MQYFKYIAVLIATVGTTLMANPFDLSKFEIIGNANWDNSDPRVLTADSGQGFVVTKQSYGNFHLTVDFFNEPNTNGGVFFRCEADHEISDKNCYEANIFDHIDDPIKRTGSIVNIAPAKVKLNTEGQWNRYEISAIDERLIVKLNGETTVDIINPRHSYGPIALQLRTGSIKYRNFYVESLDIDVEGVWDLTGFKLDDGKGNITDWCSGSHGSILYTQGYMSVSINCESDTTKKVFYSGPYHTQGKTVVHDVRNYSSENLHQVFHRKVEMPDSRHLNLVGPFGDGGKAVVYWERRTGTK